MQRMGISSDLVCTLRQKLICNRRHPVNGLHRKILKIENHYFWICPEKTDFYLHVFTLECVKAVRPWDTIESYKLGFSLVPQKFVPALVVLLNG